MEIVVGISFGALGVLAFQEVLNQKRRKEVQNRVNMLREKIEKEEEKESIIEKAVIKIDKILICANKNKENYFSIIKKIEKEINIAKKYL